VGMLCMPQPDKKSEKRNVVRSILKVFFMW